MAIERHTRIVRDIAQSGGAVFGAAQRRGRNIDPQGPGLGIGRYFSDAARPLGVATTTAAPPPPDERRGPDFAGASDLLEIAGLLIALGFSAWMFSELGARLGERVRARLNT